MTIDQITMLGDKIDIQLVQQLEQAEQGNDVNPVRTYKSSLCEILDSKLIEISMPTENGRMVLFQLGLRCRLLFYTQKGLYVCYGKVEKRYKKDNFFMLAIQLTSEPQKFQRREFYRIEKNIDFKYLIADEAILEKESTEAIFAQIQRPGYMDTSKRAISLDISGGGIKFAADERFQKNDKILVMIRLTSEKLDQMFYLVVQIVDSFQAPNNADKFISRGRFIFKDLKDREQIVRYVFDEERRIRRKEIG